VVVAAKELLIGDPGQGLVAPCDRATLLGLDELVHAVLPRPVGHDPPGVLIDDLHLAGRNDVLHVAPEQMQRGQRLADHFLTRPTHDPQARKSRAELQNAACALLRQPNRLLARPNVKVVARREAPRDIEGGGILLNIALGSLLQTRQDQGRARLVDEHAVSLVDDREMQPAQEQASRTTGHAGLEQLIQQQTRARRRSPSAKRSRR